MSYSRCDVEMELVILENFKNTVVLVILFFMVFLLGG